MRTLVDAQKPPQAMINLEARGRISEVTLRQNGQNPAKIMEFLAGLS